MTNIERVTFTVLPVEEPEEYDMPARTYWIPILHLRGRDFDLDECATFEHAMQTVARWCSQRGFSEPGWVLQASARRTVTTPTTLTDQADT